MSRVISHGIRSIAAVEISPVFYLPQRVYRSFLDPTQRTSLQVPIVCTCQHFYLISWDVIANSFLA